MSAGPMRRIHGISSMATRAVLAELAGDYAARSGIGVDVEAVGGVEAARRVEAGERFDFVVLARDVIERLALQGRVEPGSRTDLVRSEIAIAVRSGAPKPDIGSERAVREAVQRARTIGYSTGPSGEHLLALFARWRIADAIASRLVRAAPGVPVGVLIARGDAELGFQQWSELMHVPGVDVVGLLPAAIQKSTVFSAAVCATAGQPDATRAFLAFVASQDADAARRRHGMEPVRDDGH